MYKAVFVDVDGVLKPYTLQNCIESFDLEAIKGIRMLEEHGIEVCYASGKKPSYVRGCLNCSGFNGNSFIAGENGGTIISNLISVMKYEKYIEDLKFLRKNLPLDVNKWNQFSKHNLEGWIKEEEKDISLTILLSGLNPLKFTEYINDLIKSAGLKLDVMYGSSYIDVIQQGVDKSYALKVFSEKTGIDTKNIVGVGDEKNDITMLKSVGFPAAPANAISEVKGIAQERGGYMADRAIGKGFLEICWHIINLS